MAGAKRNAEMRINMELQKLYCLLELPAIVITELNQYENNRKISIDIELKKRLLTRDLWKEGIETLQELIGDDSNGIKLLWELLNLACESYKEYERKNIPIDIYIETMKFCTRFIKDYNRVHGEYKFVWGWWFPRQLSLQEFRVGCLEYEFVELEEKMISIHIPSDANLEEKTIQKSLNDFFEFRKMFFPEWVNIQMYCNSWLLSPALKELLDKDSRILNFQKFFVVESVDYEKQSIFQWVFPGYTEASDDLPEDTSLQRRMKKYLLEGKKVGSAKGYLKKMDFIS